MLNNFFEHVKEYQYLYQFFALIFAILVFAIDKFLEKIKKYQSKITLLKSIKKELELNMEWIDNVINSDEYQANYYDPTAANFKCSNDVLKAYLPNKNGFLNKNDDLMKALLALNSAIGHYNQQVSEQHDCRFNAPALIGLATTLYIKNPGVLKEWMCSEEKRPQELKFFLTELGLRNWAINNGKRNVLSPKLINALELVEKELIIMNSRKFLKRNWNILKQ